MGAQKRRVMGNKKDSFGNRMKYYEKLTGDRFPPLLPVIARLDGKNFSKWTKDLERPYDERMVGLMQTVTKKLVKETNACMGYTQSDEITLAWFSPDPKSQIFMDGRIQKMTSILASFASVYFNAAMSKFFDEPRRLAFFDCRTFFVPNIEEGANAFLWREKDATKNSIQSTARAFFSHKQLMNKTGNEMQDMLMNQHGVNWNDMPDFFKRGSFFQRRKVARRFTTEEIEKLPEKHQARTNPDLVVNRTDIIRVDMPPFTKVMNRPEVVFSGAEPVVARPHGSTWRAPSVGSFSITDGGPKGKEFGMLDGIAPRTTPCDVRIIKKRGTPRRPVKTGSSGLIEKIATRLEDAKPELFADRRDYRTVARALTEYVHRDEEKAEKIVDIIAKTELMISQSASLLESVDWDVAHAVLLHDSKEILVETNRILEEEGLNDFELEPVEEVKEPEYPRAPEVVTYEGMGMPVGLLGVVGSPEPPSRMDDLREKLDSKKKRPKKHPLLSRRQNKALRNKKK